MKVFPKLKSVLAHPKNPEQLLAVLPSAKIIEHDGKRLVQIPHGLIETRVLNTLGFQVPSPVNFYYDWPGQFKPFDHQYVTTGFVTLNKRGYVLNDMGTGKTLSILWALDYLRKAGEINRIIIAAPLSTLEHTWANAVFYNFPDLQFTVVHHVDRVKRAQLLEQDSQIYIINHDGLKILEKEIAARKDIDAIVFDELAVFRNAGTSLFKAAKNIADSREYVWGMTGRPLPKQPTDAWAQCRLITPHTVPPYFSRFRSQTMQQTSMFKWESLTSALDVVHTAMQPAVRFTRDECIDLPPTTYSTRHVEMSPEQKKLYREMSAQLKADHEGGKITAVNGAVRAMKLLQIACGTAYGDDGTVVIPAPQRLSVLREVIEESSGKVIVFVPLTAALERVARSVADYATYSIVHGQTSTTQRNKTFQDFQSTADPRVLIAHPECMAHGLNLTAATTILWFMPTNDGEIYEQACARIARPGQTEHTHIIHLEGSSAERAVYRKLQEKSCRQVNLLNMFINGELV